MTGAPALEAKGRLVTPRRPRDAAGEIIGTGAGATGKQDISEQIACLWAWRFLSPALTSFHPFDLQGVGRFTSQAVPHQTQDEATPGPKSDPGAKFFKRKIKFMA